MKKRLIYLSVPLSLSLSLSLSPSLSLSFSISPSLSQSLSLSFSLSPSLSQSLLLSLSLSSSLSLNLSISPSLSLSLSVSLSLSFSLSLYHFLGFAGDSCEYMTCPGLISPCNAHGQCLDMTSLAGQADINGDAGENHFFQSSSHGILKLNFTLNNFLGL